MRMDADATQTKVAAKVKARKPYLTKRILEAAARRGFREAAKETMAVMGYNVIAKGGWIVKIYPDGRTEKIEPLNPKDGQFKLILD